jgi:hypothetical protein
VAAPVVSTPRVVELAAPASAAAPPASHPGIVIPTTFGAQAVRPADEGQSQIDDVTRAAPPRKSRAGWWLVLPDGNEHALLQSTVVGRQPSTLDGVSETLMLTDPDGLMSKSHAVFEVVSGDLFVRDLGSTNGVVIIGSDDSETKVSSERAKVLSGDEVELGSYAITVRQGKP